MVARLSFRSQQQGQSVTAESAGGLTVTPGVEMSGEWLLEQHVRDAEQSDTNADSYNNRILNSQPDRSTFVNQEQFDRIFSYQPAPTPKFSRRKLTHSLFHNCMGFDRFIRFICSFFPILKWLPSYSWKDNLMGDAMAGLTIGVVHVPQGIAYAVLAGIEPVYGLYTSFFGVIFYMLFGTSKHVSVGSFAIIALMTGVSVRNIYQSIDDAHVQSEIRYLENANIPFDPKNYTEMVPRIKAGYAELVQAITFTSGLIHLLLGVLRVEFLASYLSDQLVNGFCTGAAVHVVVVQLGKLLEIPVAKFTGPGYLLRQVYDFARKLPLANPTALIITIASFCFLYIGKDHLNPYVRQRLPAPIPFELLLIIITTAISAIFQLHERGKITIAREIPVGLPTAHWPRFDLIPYVFGDALEIAFVVVALHLSMCRLFNRRLGTKTDNNQELYAIGLMSTFSSFFTTYPITSAIGRTMLSVECGVQSQFSAFFTASFLLVVILFVGPLLSNLPMCVLAVIIIYSMKNVFRKMPSELMHLWRVARIDFLIWIVAFLATAVLNVMQGLAVSVVFALLTTVFRVQWPRWKVLSRLSGTEEYRDAGRYSRVINVDGVRIFRFDAPLLFTNVEHFTKSVEQAIEPNSPDMAIKNELQPPKIVVKSNNEKENNVKTVVPIQHLIIDCSGFTFIDYTSVSSLADIYHQMEARDICVYFAGAKAPIRDTLEECGFYGSVDVSNFYPTIHDAVNAASAQKVIELIPQPPPDPIPNQLPLSTAMPMSPAKSARSLVNNSFMSIPSVQHPLSEHSGSTRRIRSPTNWSLHISPLTRDGRAGSEWVSPPRKLDELDDV